MVRWFRLVVGMLMEVAGGRIVVGTVNRMGCPASTPGASQGLAAGAL